MTNEKIMFMDKWVVSSSRFEMNKLSFNFDVNIYCYSEVLRLSEVFVDEVRRKEGENFVIFIMIDSVDNFQKRGGREKNRSIQLTGVN